jgi:hypothetical protein
MRNRISIKNNIIRNRNIINIIGSRKKLNTANNDISINYFIERLKRMKIPIVTKISTILLTLLTSLLLLYSCSSVKYFTYYEGGHDPLYNIKEAKTIGFAPQYWTNLGKAVGYDELAEKQIFVYARNELQKRGYKVVYIPPEYLEQDPATSAIYVKESFKDMPDLTLTVLYYQGLGNKVQVPGQSIGTLNWANKSGSGYYGQTQGYEVQTYFLVLGFTLWSGTPKYTNKAWEGIIKKGSPKLDLFEQAQYMTEDIFHQKFDTGQ